MEEIKNKIVFLSFVTNESLKVPSCIVNILGGKCFNILFYGFNLR